MPSTRRSGKNVTAANLAYYTVKNLRSGRRSLSYRKSDVTAFRC